MIKDSVRVALSNAVAAIQEAKRALSISQAAIQFGVSKSTLSARLRGRRNQVSYGRNQVSYGCSKQKLTQEEKASIETWVLQLQA